MLRQNEKNVKIIWAEKPILTRTFLKVLFKSVPGNGKNSFYKDFLVKK